MLELFPVVVFQLKRILRVDPFTDNRNCIEQSKWLDCDRKIQNDVWIGKTSWTHIMTINQHNSILHDFLSPTDQKCAGSSTYWQFFYYRPPGKFREIIKMRCQELHTHTHIYDLSIIDMDFVYQFNVKLIAPLFTFSLKKKWFLKFSKVHRSVIGWRSG